MKLPPKKTKIVCTIGPASQSRETLERLISNGMNVARVNFAHGDFEGHKQVIKNIRAAAAAVGQRVAIFGDLPGPKMRIGKLIQEPIELLRDQSFILQSNEIVGHKQRVSTSFKDLPKVVKPGDNIYLNDGYIQLAVKKVDSQEVHCKVVVGGELRSHKGINLPGIDLGIGAFTERDQTFLQFAAEQQLDGVSQSFVQNKEDVDAVRQAAAALDYKPFIIAKIERSRAVDNLDEILASADGIMVARGDLGVEIPIEQVANVQKQVITQANRRAKPVITATHMLESMTNYCRPTRAEATDVANAILDGTDCVMLSGETAVGHYPAEAVDVMTRIAQVTEEDIERNVIVDLLELGQARGEITQEDLISLSIFLTTETLQPAFVFVPSLSGSTARRVTRFRIPVWIVAFSHNKATCQKLQFSFGIYPVCVPKPPGSWTQYTRDWSKQYNLVEDLVILTESTGEIKAGGATYIEILDLRYQPAG